MSNRLDSILVTGRPPAAATAAWLAATLDRGLAPAHADGPGAAAELARARGIAVLHDAGAGADGRWHTAIAPITGGHAGADALAFAAGLAHALDMRVYAAYVAVLGSRPARYADALHHEYAHQLDEFVARALPDCSDAVRATVCGVLLGRGEPAKALVTLAADVHAELVVTSTEAVALGDLPARPVLFVPPAARRPFRLKVADAFG